MVLVREDRDIGSLVEVVGNREGTRRRDVVEADRPERGADRNPGFDDGAGVRGRQADRKGVDPREGLEDDALAFSDRYLRLHWPGLPSKQVGPVGQDRHGIAPAGEIEAAARVVLDGKAGFGHAGGVDERQDRAIPDRDLAADPDQAPIAASIVQPLVVLIVDKRIGRSIACVLDASPRHDMAYRRVEVEPGVLNLVL